MKKQTKILVAVIGIVLLLILGTGGKKYMDYKKEEDRKAEQAQLVDAKKEVALYIVQNYEGVKKIQFGDLDENKMTGTWSLNAKINQSNLISFIIDDVNNSSVGLGTRTNPKTFKLKAEKRPNASIKNIEIKYEGAFK